MIVTVVLDRLYLTPVSDFTAGMSFLLNDIEYSDAVFVTIGQYAAGNFRARRQKGKQRTAKVTLLNRTDVQAQQLQDWQGVVLCLRDPRGRKFFGLYTDPDVHPSRVPNCWDVSFSVTEVTYSEAS